MKPALVCLRPDYETATHWGQYWFRKALLDQLDLLKIPYVDLYSLNATKGVMAGQMRMPGNVDLCGIGHGNEWMIVGHNNDLLLDRRNPDDLDLMKEKHGSFLSCNFGLAADTFVNAGMLSFMGCKVTYYFVISTYPNAYAEPFFDSHITYDISKVRVPSMTQAFGLMLDRYDAWIIKSPDTIVRYLKPDRDGMYLSVRDDRSPWAPEEPTYKCCRCPKEFDTCDLLIDHIVTEHHKCPPWPDRPTWCKFFGWVVGCPLTS